MKKAIIFASYIPTKDKIYIGQEFLDFFEKFYSDYDLYVGMNPSCVEWIEILKNRSINYKITEEKFVVPSDVSAYQTALKLLKESNKEYDLYTFAHTKGVTSNAHTFRKYVFDNFLLKNKEIEKIFENDETVGLFSLWVTKCSTKNSIRESLNVFLGHLNECQNTDTMTQYTFYTMKGLVLNKFIKEVNDLFWNEKITDIKYPYHSYIIVNNHHIWDYNSPLGTIQFNNDIYFFERDFPMIVERYCHKIINKID